VARSAHTHAQCMLQQRVGWISIRSNLLETCLKPGFWPRSPYRQVRKLFGGSACDQLNLSGHIETDLACLRLQVSDKFHLMEFSLYVASVNWWAILHTSAQRTVDNLNKQTHLCSIEQVSKIGYLLSVCLRNTDDNNSEPHAKFGIADVIVRQQT